MNLLDLIEREYLIKIPKGSRIVSWTPPMQSLNNVPMNDEIDLTFAHPVFGKITLNPTRMSQEVITAIGEYTKVQK